MSTHHSRAWCRAWFRGCLACTPGLEDRAPTARAAFVDDVRKGSAPLAPKLDLPVLAAGSIRVTPRLRAALDAGKVDVADLAGRTVILNFFQSYCAPCREEAPLLAETFVISSSGHVVDHVIGRLTETKMAQVVAAATAATRMGA